MKPLEKHVLGRKGGPMLRVFLTGLIGALIGISPLGLKLEEELGLSSLFTVRGPIAPPLEAIIVNIDKSSVETLNVAADTRDWDRRLHACLIDELLRLGASMVVFDLAFITPRDSFTVRPARAPQWSATRCRTFHSLSQDKVLADAMARAGNVILVQSITLEQSQDWVMERLVDPVVELADAALGVAPFPLPKAPARVSQFWAFKTAVGDVPTLPVVALQALSPRSLTLFHDAAQQPGASAFAQDSSAPVDRLMRTIRSRFKDDPLPSRRRVHNMLASATQLTPMDKKISPVLETLYVGPDSYYLNLYGPAGTIANVRYYDVIARDGLGRRHQRIDFANKIVFVGASVLSTPQQSDSYYTVYRSQDGVDLSGVEIAATAFANLLTDRMLRVPAPVTSGVILMAFGCLVAMLMTTASLAFSIIAVLSVSVLYTIAVQYAFNQYALWLPAAVPLLIQLPIAVLLGVFSEYRREKGDRVLISSTLDKYIPHQIAQQILATGGDITPVQATATILYSDIEGFTTICEQAKPENVVRMLNEYFSAVSNIISRHDGIIAQFDGDALLATFNVPITNTDHADCAVRVAMEMHQLLKEEDFAGHRLNIRVGINTGDVAAGNVGGTDKIQYTVHGDAVNVAARLEQYNKQLGTRVLISENTVERLRDSYPIESVGAVQIRGRTAPLNVFKLTVLKR